MVFTAGRIYRILFIIYSTSIYAPHIHVQEKERKEKEKGKKKIEAFFYTHHPLSFILKKFVTKTYKTGENIHLLLLVCSFVFVFRGSQSWTLKQVLNKVFWIDQSYQKQNTKEGNIKK